MGIRMFMALTEALAFGVNVKNDCAGLVPMESQTEHVTFV